MELVGFMYGVLAMPCAYMYMFTLFACHLAGCQASIAGARQGGQGHEGCPLVLVNLATTAKQIGCAPSSGSPSRVASRLPGGLHPLLTQPVTAYQAKPT